MEQWVWASISSFCFGASMMFLPIQKWITDLNPKRKTTIGVLFLIVGIVFGCEAFYLKLNPKIPLNTQMRIKLSDFELRNAQKIKFYRSQKEQKIFPDLFSFHNSWNNDLKKYLNENNKELYKRYISREAELTAEMNTMDDWSKYSQTLVNMSEENKLLEQFISELRVQKPFKVPSFVKAGSGQASQLFFDN